MIDWPQLRDRTGVFHDRRAAGAALADLLAPEVDPAAIVLAIPAGGVPVAVVVAERLGLPLDLVVVSKITLPWDPESGYGAVAFDGTVEINIGLVQHLGLSHSLVEQGTSRTRDKVMRRERELRGDRPPLALAGRRAILVDDGLASGFTMRVAVAAVRAAGAARIVVAVPTAHRDAAAALEPEVDELYCANLRGGRSYAVAAAYQRWRDVDEPDVVAALAGVPFAS